MKTAIVNNKLLCNKCGSKVSRSDAQNRYLHCILGIWASDIGCSLEELKVDVKEALGLCYERTSSLTGKSTIIYESSKLWDKEKFARVTQWVIITAGSQGCKLQTPNEFYGIEEN